MSIDRLLRLKPVERAGMVKPGDPTPWGPAQHVERLADGIELVSTPSHGGIKLSAPRLGAMPPTARTDDGWYEEDCEACWPLRAFATDCGLSDKNREGVDVILSHYKHDFSRCRMAGH